MGKVVEMLSRRLNERMPEKVDFEHGHAILDDTKMSQTGGAAWTKLLQAQIKTQERMLALLRKTQDPTCSLEEYIGSEMTSI